MRRSKTLFSGKILPAKKTLGEEKRKSRRRFYKLELWVWRMKRGFPAVLECKEKIINLERIKMEKTIQVENKSSSSSTLLKLLLMMMRRKAWETKERGVRGRWRRGRRKLDWDDIGVYLFVRLMVMHKPLFLFFFSRLFSVTRKSSAGGETASKRKKGGGFRWWAWPCRGGKKGFIERGSDSACV